jgi:hypothetical protein
MLHCDCLLYIVHTACALILKIICNVAVNLGEKVLDCCAIIVVSGSI